MPKLRPPGYTPPPREPVFVLEEPDRTTVKTWIQNYSITEDKELPYGRVASAAKREFRRSIGQIPQPTLIEIITEIDNEWHPGP